MASDHEKYIHTLSKVESRQTQEVKDIIINPPNKKYEALKKAIYTAIDRLAQTQNIRQLLETEEMGDRKRHSFYDTLATLAGTAVSEKLLCIL